MIRIFFLLLLLTLCLAGNAQIPSTKETIQNFIDSIGESNDRQLIESSIFPAVANGTNFKWRQKMWRNNKKELLWVETIVPDSISTVYFYCHDTLIFASERTYVTDSISNKRKSLFKNIYIHGSRIIEDSAPGRNNNPIEHYLKESREYLEHAKLAN